MKLKIVGDVVVLLMFLMQATMEHRRLAVDLSEVIVKWESQRIKEESEENSLQASFDFFYVVVNS